MTPPKETAPPASGARTHRVCFPTEHPPVPLPELASLSERLTMVNSPVLFGCRTGICGTCVSRVEALAGELPPPDSDEAELLAVIAPDEPRARLLCRLRLTADIRVEPLHP